MSEENANDRRTAAHQAIDKAFDEPELADSELARELLAQARIESWFRGIVAGFFIAVLVFTLVQKFGGEELADS
jgi:hypothetical protein